MWTCKLQLNGEKAQIRSLAKEQGIELFGFPMSYNYQKNFIEVNISGNLFGEEKSKKQFLRNMKKAKRVLHFELNNDFFIGTILEPKYAKPIYNSKILHLSPVHIDKFGKETINIGSFDRKDLIEVTETLKKHFEVKLIAIKEKKITNISLFKQNPKLTEKQKEAIKLAIENGYYNFPRNIELIKLAKLMNCSYSTYQAHLRKAEKHIMPSYGERLASYDA